MIQEINKEEALALALLGEIRLGLLVEISSGELVMENLLLRNNQCFYYNQGDSELAEWGNSLKGLSNFKDIITMAGMDIECPSWVKIHRIFLLEEL